MIRPESTPSYRPVVGDIPKFQHDLPQVDTRAQFLRIRQNGSDMLPQQVDTKICLGAKMVIAERIRALREAKNLRYELVLEIP